VTSYIPSIDLRSLASFIRPRHFLIASSDSKRRYKMTKNDWSLLATRLVIGQILIRY
jgi:hypothetical protein